jgi:hypothetical protein
MIRVALNDSRYVFHNCVNIDDRLRFFFRSQFEENTIVFVKSFRSKALMSILSLKLGE